MSPSRSISLSVAFLFVISAVACLASVSSGTTIPDQDPVRVDRGDHTRDNLYYFAANEDGTWQAVVENHGLRAVRIVVYDDSGHPERKILNQRINFAEAGAYPIGTVISDPIEMLDGRSYKIVPRNAVGPKGAHAIVYDEFKTQSEAWPVMIDLAERVHSGVDLSVLGSNVYVLSYEYDDGPVRLYRSDNGGAFWSAPIDVFGETLRYMEPGMSIYRDSGTDNIIVASGHGLLRKSTDGGLTWTSLSDLPGYYWRFMAVGTNASWLGVPADQDIYVVGCTSYDTYGNLAITKSADAGASWSEPIVFAQTGSCPEIISDGTYLYVVYTSPHPYEGAVYIKKSSDWGVTWSAEKLLIAPGPATKNIRAYSLQYIHPGEALMAISVQAVSGDVGEGYGAYGLLDLASLTFEETNRLAGPYWNVYEGIAAHSMPDGSTAIAWLKHTQLTLSQLMFTYI